MVVFLRRHFFRICCLTRHGIADRNNAHETDSKQTNAGVNAVGQGLRFDAIKADVAYTPDQFCGLMGVTRKTLAEWRRSLSFPVRDTVKGGMILGSDVIEWIRSRPLVGSQNEAAT
jgi:hypothetical protein